MFHLRLVEPLVPDHVVVEIDIRMLIGLNEFLADAESLFQRGDGRLLVPGFGLDVSSFDSKLVEVARCFGGAVISRQHDQCVFQANLAVYISKQIRQHTVQPQQVVFHFEAGRPEEVPDVVGG